MELFGRDTMNAPWGLDSRLKLTALACDFFNANKMVANRERIGKESPKGGNQEPLSATDFLKYLEVIGAFQKFPNAIRVAQIVDRMASSGLLLRVGHEGLSIGGLDDHFLYVPTEWDARRGLFRLVPVLGPEYLYWLCAPGFVTHHRDERSGQCGRRNRACRPPFLHSYLPSCGFRHDRRRETVVSRPGIRCQQ